MLYQTTKEAVPHIVLTNENPDECKLLQDALHKHNITCSVSVIPNGETLLSLLKEQNFTPDVILWDLGVPCTTYKNCLQLIKKRKKLRSIPVVIFSRSNNIHNKDYCYNTQPNEYFLRALTFLL